MFQQDFRLMRAAGGADHPPLASVRPAGPQAELARIERVDLEQEHWLVTGRTKATAESARAGPVDHALARRLFLCGLQSGRAPNNSRLAPDDRYDRVHSRHKAPSLGA